MKSSLAQWWGISDNASAMETISWRSMKGTGPITIGYVLL
ncbi:DUF1266 domain-containing protein [Filimonas effusa]|nr:DUF1266 domain-containing protein [Filimonas effusa]